MPAVCRSALRRADVAELADAPDLGSGGRPCRFDSCHPQLEAVILEISGVAVSFHYQRMERRV